MDKVKAYIELLEDLEIDDPQRCYPIFDETKYYGNDFKEIFFDPLDKSARRGPFMVFGWKPFERVFMRLLDYQEKDGNIFFRTEEVIDEIKKASKSQSRKRNYPCFIR